MPENEEKILPIGGQAVIEGVLMRSPKAYAIAVRKNDGSIEIKEKEEPSWTKRNRLLGLPFIRGIATLLESLTLGVSALFYSANLSVDKNEQISKGEFTLSLILSFSVSIALFIALPAGVFALLRNTPMPTIALNLIEGFIRISIFLCFLLVVSRFKDMQRIFEYHGAEHKIVHLFQEKNSLEGLSVKDALKFKTMHPSCGTSFLLIVFIVSIIVFSFLGRPTYLYRVLYKIMLLPVITGIAYEIIRIARRKESPVWIKALVAPGMWLQRITTKEPDEKQLEVAMEALKHALR